MKSFRTQPLRSVYRELGALLYDTMVLLYTTDFIKQETEIALQNTSNILSRLEDQAAIEEAILFPALHDYEPSMVAILRDDHRARMQYVHRLQAMIQSSAKGCETYQSILFSSRLLRHFNEFMTCCLEQMENHENLVNPVLWRYYSDEELHLVEMSIRELQADMPHRPAIAMSKKKRQPVMM